MYLRGTITLMVQGLEVRVQSWLSTNEGVSGNLYLITALDSMCRVPKTGLESRQPLTSLQSETVLLGGPLYL